MKIANDLVVLFIHSRYIWQLIIDVNYKSHDISSISIVNHTMQTMSMFSCSRSPLMRKCRSKSYFFVCVLTEQNRLVTFCDLSRATRLATVMKKKVLNGLINNSQLVALNKITFQLQ